jgi:hypothetical protein
MTRRRLLLFGLPIALVVLGVALWLLWPRSSAITPENYERIQGGMTFEQVQAILGGPPGNYGVHDPRIVQSRDAIDVARLADCRYLQWYDSAHMIGVQFDVDDRVVGKDLGDVTPAPLWRQALSWLRL